MEDTPNMAAHKVGPENSGPAVADAGQGAASQLDPATSKRKLCAKKRHDIHIALGLPASAVYQDDYSCALKRRGILLQGRMYVYDTHVAFYSNLLFGSFVTKLVIPVRSITCVSKHSNLGFPNSIKIRRGAFVDTFTSFLSRGAAFELVSRMVAVQQQTREAHEGQEQLSRRTTSQLLAKSGSAMSGGSSSVAGLPSPDGSVSVPRPSSPPGNSAAHSAVSSPRQQQQQLQQLSGNETADRSTSARNSISSSSCGGGGAGRHASMDGSSSSSCVPSPNGADSTRRASSSAVSSCSSLSTSSCTFSSTAPPCTTATTSPASCSSLPIRASSLTTSASRCLISWGSASTLSSPGARKAHTFFASRWSRNSSSNSSSSTSGTTAQPLTHSFSSPFTCPPLPENSEPAAPGPQAVTTPCPAQRLPGARTGSCGLLRFAVVLAAAVSLLLLLVASFRVGERAYAYSANRAPQQAEMLRQRADGLQGRREDAAMEGDTVAMLRAHAQVILNEFALVSRGLSAVSHELGAVAGQMTAEGAAAAAGCGAAIGCCGGELRCGGRFAGGKG